MKKVILLIMAIMLLSSCSCIKNTGSKNNYFDKTMNATETILNCLSENNADGIKELLCQRTKELPDIDKQIQAMLDYFDGKVVSYNNEKKSVKKTSASKDDGVWTEISAYGHIPEIVTDTGKKYKELHVFYRYVDAKQPDLVGVTTIILTGADGTECYVSIEKPD
ncbi:MAG: DUF5104 domain-containing protein [Clostridiaceae bacterium]